MIRVTNYCDKTVTSTAMLGRFKSAVYNAIGGLEDEGVVNGIKHPSPVHTR